MIRALWRRARGTRPADAGSINLFVVITGVAVILAGGLVIDGGLKLRAGREAATIAEEAARAGAGQVDQNSLYGEGGKWTVDPDKAVAAANAYLADTGHEGTAALTDGGQTVEVTVTITHPTAILSMIGIGDVTVTKTAQADLVQGVEGENQ